MPPAVKPKLVFISNFSIPGRGTYEVASLLAGLPSFSVFRFDAMDDGGRRGPMITVRAVIALFRLLRRHPNAIVLADTSQGMQLVGIAMLLRSGHRFVLRIGSVYQHSIAGLGFKASVKMRLRNFAIRKASHVVVPSDSSRHALIAAGLRSEAGLTVIPNGRELPASPPPVFLAGTPLALRFIGRLEAEKAPELAIRTLAECRGRHRLPAELDLFGEGDLRLALTRLAASLGVEEYVRFHGYVSDPWAEVRPNTLLIHTSERDGFGYAVLEAIGRGVPCLVIAGVGGPEEIVAATGGGQVVAQRSAQAMAEGVRDIFSKSGGLAERMAQAREEASARYTPAKMVAAYDALLSRLAPGTSR